MTETIREVVAVFEDAEALDAAVFDLETHGFDRAAFSLLASEHAVAQKLGHRYRRIEEMEDEARAPRETFFSKVSRLEAEYGPAPALALIAGAAAGLGAAAPALPIVIAAGGGAAIGAVLGRLIHQHHAKLLQEQLQRGGLLLWVGVRNAEEERDAIRILEARAARDVHAHDIAA